MKFLGPKAYIGVFAVLVCFPKAVGEDSTLERFINQPPGTKILNFVKKIFRRRKALIGASAIAGRRGLRAFLNYQAEARTSARETPGFRTDEAPAAQSRRWEASGARRKGRARIRLRWAFDLNSNAGPAKRASPLAERSTRRTI